MQRPRSKFEHLALDFVRVTERAAIAASAWIGKGDAKAADKAAVDAMRRELNQIEFSGQVVIGEGAKDESFELFVGEKLGRGNGVVLDIAVDPLECTSSVAHGRPNALTTIAVAPKGALYKAADSYMEKIAVGPAARGTIDLAAPVRDNLRKVARALGKKVGELTVAVLDRPRHEKLIRDIRRAGARVQLFTDGDIAMALAPSLKESPVDMLFGIGGSAEAVLAAAALRTLGGELLVRWKPKDETHIARLRKAGITKFDRIMTERDLAKGNDVAFTASGVIEGPLLKGVVVESDVTVTHTLVISSNPGTVRFLKTEHRVAF
jgi:fructose-1,6-bisphosphatase II